ncbi:MAG: dTMP kinase [Desulfomonilaceae bacterium]
MFIVFEGIDGSGKTTQARLLADFLESRGILFVLTREPSDGAIGKQLRHLTSRLTPEEESVLFLEDRLHHFETLIGPALKAGKHVICDRYYYSSAAYQGAQGLNPDAILNKNRSVVPAPDIVFLIRVSVETAIMRIGKSRLAGLSVFEKTKDLQTVSAIYDSFQDPIIKRIDGEQTISKGHMQITNWLRLMGMNI